MKKLISSIFSVVTSFTVLACSTLSPASAESGVSVYEWDCTENELFLGDIEFGTLELPNYPKITSNYTDGAYNYGDFLDENNLAVYKAFKELNKPIDGNITVKLPETVTLQLSALPGSDDFTDEDNEKFELAVFGNCKPAIDSALFDMPELYWIDPTRMSIGLGSDATASKSGWFSSGYTIKIRSLVINITYLNCFSSLDDAASYGILLEEAVENFPVSGETRYDQLKNIHDYIAKFTYYDLDAKFSSSALGAIVEPGVVCEGYSEAFKLICDRLEIPCVCVFGNLDTETNIGHMWNYVRMDDDKWYAVDLTWDDVDGSGGRQVKYDYFLKGSDSFFQNHTPEPDYNITRFIYPEISESDYVYDNSTTPITTTETTTTTTSTTTTLTTTTSTSTTSTSTTSTTTTSTTTTSTTTTSTTTTSTTTTSTTTTSTTTTSTTTTSTTTTSTTTTSTTTTSTTTTSTTTTSTTTTSTTTTSTTTTSTTTSEKNDEPLIGDLNHDGNVNVADLVYCQAALLGKIKSQYSLDCNGDGIVDVFDLVFMRKLLLKSMFMK